MAMGKRDDSGRGF